MWMDNVLCHKAVSMVPMHTAYYKKPNSILARFLFHGQPIRQTNSLLYHHHLLYSIKYTCVENSQQMLCCTS